MLFSGIQNKFLTQKRDFGSWKFSTLKWSAKRFGDFLKENYTLNKFVFMRTIDIPNRQAKMFYP